MIHYLNSSSTCLLFLKKKWMVISLRSPLFPAPKTWLHVPWRVTLVCNLVTFYGPWFSRLQLLGPKSRIACGMEALRDSCHMTAKTTCPVQIVGYGTKSKSGSLLPAHISSRRSRNLNAWNRLPRRRQVEDIWLANNCMLWPVTLVALFHALDNTVCTVSQAKISKFPVLVIFCLPAAFDASVALFAFVFVGNSSGFESIFETPCTTNFPKHYKPRLQPKPPVNDHLL